MLLYKIPIIILLTTIISLVIVYDLPSITKEANSVIIKKYSQNGVSNPTLFLFSITKDDESYLRIWIKYHRKLFKKQNILIIDNNSTDSTGGHLKTGNSMSDHSYVYNQGGLATEFLKFNGNGIYFFIDTDEFLGVLHDNGSVSMRPQDVMMEINYLYYFKFECAMYSHCFVTSNFNSFTDKLTYSKNWDCDISIALSNTKFIFNSFKSGKCGQSKVIINKIGEKYPAYVTGGYHATDRLCGESKLILIHYKNRPFISQLKHCFLDLAGFHYIKFEPGMHLKSEFYQDLYDKKIISGFHKRDFLLKIYEMTQKNVSTSSLYHVYQTLVNKTVEDESCFESFFP